MTRPYLGNPKYTIEVLQKYNFAFQKRFGQNFLIEYHVLEKIIEASKITKDDFVLEIGPGIGTMTQYLAEAAREVVAVEIDKTLIPILENDTLKDWDNVTVINEDILKVDIAALAQEKNGGKPIKVVVNCLIILPHQSSWDFLKTMFPFLPSPLWYRRKWQTECRLVLEQRITVLCLWLFSIMPDRRSLRMFRQTVLCQDRRWEVLLSSL